MNAPPNMAGQPGVTELQSWSELNRQWLVSAMSRLCARLEAGIAAGPGSPLPAKDSVGDEAAAAFTPGLIHIARIFGLSVFERELLLLCAGAELDHGLRACLTTLQAGQPKVSFGLALSVLAAPHWDALSTDRPLRLWRMIELDRGGGLTGAALRIDERVLHFLTGVAATDAALAGVATLVDGPAAPDASDAALVKRVCRQLGAEAARGPAVVVQSGANDKAALRDFALAAAADMGRPALWIEARDLPSDPAELARLALHIDRETALSGALPVLAFDEPGAQPPALSLTARLRSGLLWLGAFHPDLAALPQGGRLLRFDLPAPDGGRTRAALHARWRRLGIDRMDAATQSELDRAAAQFHLGPAAVDGIAERLLLAAPAERLTEIWPAAREAARGGLDAMAQRIETGCGFDDVVLPSGHKAMLADIAGHLRQRGRVFLDWGFAAKHPLGQGLVALFAGESGTGKTLAAGAIANAADLDLYRVDLAALVSKYIGETEKNLKRLFDAAEASGAVLLFDEADALFGKRSEVKDSHDRYANIEVAYLLQKIEAYRGLAILTTNMKSALDRAFLRRIRFVITFPFPDAAAREEIWRRQFPSGAPLGDINYAALAALNIPGGNIRSIALSAAFKAADAGGEIDQKTLMAAAREEFAKLERPMGGMAGGAG